MRMSDRFLKYRIWVVKSQGYSLTGKQYCMNKNSGHVSQCHWLQSLCNRGGGKTTVSGSLKEAMLTNEI